MWLVLVLQDVMELQVLFQVQDILQVVVEDQTLQIDHLQVIKVAVVQVVALMVEVVDKQMEEMEQQTLVVLEAVELVVEHQMVVEVVQE